MSTHYSGFSNTVFLNEKGKQMTIHADDSVMALLFNPSRVIHSVEWGTYKAQSYIYTVHNTYYRALMNSILSRERERERLLAVKNQLSG
jgi:hypothetical protein